MRIFRTAILLIAAGFLLPSPPEDGGAQANADESSTPRLLTSATLAVVDAASFCERQPLVCRTAGYAASRLEAKVKYSIKLAYEWANEPDATARPSLRGALSAGGDMAASDPIATNATDKARSAGGRSTLTIADLIPEWRGPTARPRGS